MYTESDPGVHKWKSRTLGDIVRDWITIAKARGVEIPEPELRLVSKTLVALEATFRPLVGDVDVWLEPAAVFQPEEDTGDYPGSR